MKNFKIQDKGVVYRFYFKSWNEKVVRCVLEVEYQNGMLEGTYHFVGKALCNKKAGDIFNLQEGQEIAMDRCLLQHQKFIHKIVEDISKIKIKQFEMSSESMNRFKDLWEK